MKAESEKRKEKKYKLDSNLFLYYFCLFTIFFFLFSFRSTHAATVSNDNFQLELEQFEPIDEQRPLPTQSSQPGQSGSPGVAYIPSEFSFVISNSLIDFGVISATSPVTRDMTLTVRSPGSGYQVFAFANHPLYTEAKKISIPDTTCDNGSCSEVTTSVWENNLTYGFGFRCDSQIQALCPMGFEDKKAFKQFPDLSKKEVIQPILQSNSQTNSHEARITYRVNISGTQQKEAYSNTVTYIAVPNF